MTACGDDDLAEAIWRYVLGELSSDEEKALLAKAANEPAIAERIAECRRFDRLMAYGLQHTPRTTEALADDLFDEVPYVPSGNRPHILFPSWARAVQLTAACAAVLIVLFAILPRGDLQWNRTEIALLDATRSDTEPPRSSAFDRREIRAACARLQESIEKAYQETTSDDSPSWKLGICFTEFADGSFELKVHGPSQRDPAQTVEVSQVYDNLKALNAGHGTLAARVVERLRDSAR
jgi:hypothetical protein